MLAELDGGRGHTLRRPDRQVTPPFLSLPLLVCTQPQLAPTSTFPLWVRNTPQRLEGLLPGGLHVAWASKLRPCSRFCSASLLRLMSPLSPLPTAPAP